MHRFPAASGTPLILILAAAVLLGAASARSGEAPLTLQPKEWRIDGRITTFSPITTDDQVEGASIVLSAMAATMEGGSTRFPPRPREKTLEITGDVLLYVGDLPEDSPAAKAVKGKAAPLKATSPEALALIQKAAGTGWPASLIGADIDRGQVRVLAIGAGYYYAVSPGSPPAKPRVTVKPLKVTALLNKPPAAASAALGKGTLEDSSGGYKIYSHERAGTEWVETRVKGGKVRSIAVIVKGGPDLVEWSVWAPRLGIAPGTPVVKAGAWWDTERRRPILVDVRNVAALTAVSKQHRVQIMWEDGTVTVRVGMTEKDLT